MAPEEQGLEARVREMVAMAGDLSTDDDRKQQQGSQLDNYLHSLKLPLLRVHSKARLFLKRLSRIIFHRKALNFNSALIKDGDLVFDVGANMGDMTALYVKLGALVVSIEPQETCLGALRKRFGNNPKVTIVPTPRPLEDHPKSWTCD